jgi:glycerate kinase
MPGAEIDSLPIADGGDATAKVLVEAVGGTFVEAPAKDPLGRERTAHFGLLAGGTEAIIDVAETSGLARLASNERDPMRATSFGAGQLVRAALDRGAKRILVALGGSATVDGGTGVMEALGARFLDARGASVPRGGGGLERISRIDLSALDPRLATTTIIALADVDNPLLGSAGAARTFGTQKGANAQTVEQLEKGLAHLADLIARHAGRDVRAVKHGGAAGGIAAALAGILGARLESGADAVLERIGVQRHLIGKDVVLTAEGHLDRQTLANKGPYALARASRAAGVPIIALVGGIADGVDATTFDLFDAIVPICPRPMPLDEAMRRAAQHLDAAAACVGRLLRIAPHRG